MDAIADTYNNYSDFLNWIIKPLAIHAGEKTYANRIMIFQEKMVFCI